MTATHISRTPVSLLLAALTLVACSGSTRLANVSDSPSVLSSAPRIAIMGVDDGWVFVSWLEGSDVKVKRVRMGYSSFEPAIDLGPSQGATTFLSGMPIVTAGSHVHVLIPHWPPGGMIDLFVASSQNEGGTFLPRVNVSSSPNHSFNAAIAASGDRVFVAWRESVGMADHVMVSESADGGATFSPPTALTVSGADDVGPAVAISDDRVFVLYCTTAAQTAVRARLLTAGTFEPEQILNPSGATSPCGNERLDAWGSTVRASWTEAGQLFVAKSIAGGSFGTPLSLPASGSVRTVGLEAIGSDRFHVAWVEDNQELWTAGSVSGTSFDLPTRLLTTDSDNPQSVGMRASGEFVHFIWSEPPGDASNSDSPHRQRADDFGRSFQSQPTRFVDENDALLAGWLTDMVVSGSDYYVAWRRNHTGGSDVWFRSWRRWRSPF